MAMSNALMMHYRAELIHAPTKTDLARVSRSIYMMYHRGKNVDTVHSSDDDIIATANAMLFAV